MMPCPCDKCEYERCSMQLAMVSLFIIVAPIVFLWVMQKT